MKKIFVGILAVGMLGFAFTTKSVDETVEVKTEQADSVDGIKFFKGTWAEALAEAEKENKLIFLDAYASWCGPCKRMAATTFTEKEVGDFFNENFINFKMDMEKHAEGRRLSQKFHLTAYPSLYFLDGKEEVKHKIVGGQSKSGLIGHGKTAMTKK
jgi:thiol:disulfide interchange protein